MLGKSLSSNMVVILHLSNHDLEIRKHHVLRLRHHAWPLPNQKTNTRPVFSPHVTLPRGQLWPTTQRNKVLWANHVCAFVFFVTLFARYLQPKASLVHDMSPFLRSGFQFVIFWRQTDGSMHATGCREDEHRFLAFLLEVITSWIIMVFIMACLYCTSV